MFTLIGYFPLCSFLRLSKTIVYLNLTYVFICIQIYIFAYYKYTFIYKNLTVKNKKAHKQ